MADEKTQAEIDAENKAAEEAKKTEAARKAEEEKFNPAQQEKVNNLLESAQDRGFAAGAKKGNDKAEALQKELDALKVKPGAHEPKEKDNVDVEELVKEIATLKAEGVKNHERSINASLLTEISDFDVVNPRQMAELLRGHIKVDAGGQLSVQSADGALKINAQGNPMTVKEYIGKWLEGNPHMLKAAGSAGSGSRAGDYTNNGDGKTMTRADFDELPPEEKSKVALDKDITIVDAA